MDNCSYLLELTKKNGNLEDYNILFSHEVIGELQLTIHSKYVFIRQISILEDLKRLGHATKVIDYLRKKYRKPIELCISTHSNSAILLWNNYFNGKTVLNLRGNIFRL